RTRAKDDAFAILEQLGARGEPASPNVARWLDSSRWSQQALRALSSFGPNAKFAVATIHGRWLKHARSKREEKKVRASCLDQNLSRALVRLGAASIEALQESYRTGDDDERYWSILMLERIVRGSYELSPLPHRFATRTRTSSRNSKLGRPTSSRARTSRTSRTTRTSSSSRRPVSSRTKLRRPSDLLSVPQTDGVRSPEAARLLVAALDSRDDEIRQIAYRTLAEAFLFDANGSTRKPDEAIREPEAEPPPSFIDETKLKVVSRISPALEQLHLSSAIVALRMGSRYSRHCNQSEPTQSVSTGFLMSRPNCAAAGIRLFFRCDGSPSVARKLLDLLEVQIGRLSNDCNVLFPPPGHLAPWWSVVGSGGAPSVEVFSTLVESLSERWDVVTPLVIERLESGRARGNYLRVLLYLLRESRSDAKIVLPALVPFLASDNPEISGFVSDHLALLGKSSTPALPVLVEAIRGEIGEGDARSPTSGLAERYFLVLEKMGEAAASALAGFADSKPHAVRRRAIQALLKVDAPRPVVRKALEAFQTDSEPALRRYAEWAHKRLDFEELAPAQAPSRTPPRPSTSNVKTRRVVPVPTTRGVGGGRVGGGRVGGGRGSQPVRN
ncbi:MAG: hypothetical protein AAF517_08930, partial [Planctomycetota bacterium]